MSDGGSFDRIFPTHAVRRLVLQATLMLDAARQSKPPRPAQAVTAGRAASSGHEFVTHASRQQVGSLLSSQGLSTDHIDVP